VANGEIREERGEESRRDRSRINKIRQKKGFIAFCYKPINKK
jgi:hypothetical protein